MGSVNSGGGVNRHRRCLGVRSPGRDRWATQADVPKAPRRATGILTCAEENARMKLKLDLHDIHNQGAEIDRALRAIIDEAVAKKAPLVEIIPGKGSGGLKTHVLRFLNHKEIKALGHRVEKDSDNF